MDLRTEFFFDDNKFFHTLPDTLEFFQSPRLSSERRNMDFSQRSTSVGGVRRKMG